MVQQPMKALDNQIAGKNARTIRRGYVTHLTGEVPKRNYFPKRLMLSQAHRGQREYFKAAKHAAQASQNFIKIALSFKSKKEREKIKNNDSFQKIEKHINNYQKKPTKEINKTLREQYNKNRANKNPVAQAKARKRWANRA